MSVTVEDAAQPTRRHQPAASRYKLRTRMAIAMPAIPLLVAVSVLVAAIRAYASRRPWMIFFEDDFFYYMKVAESLAHGRGSTFNGLAETNGYHPLWLLTLAGLSYLGAHGWGIFAGVATIVLVSTLVTFYFADQLMQQAVMPRLLQRVLAAYVAIYALHLFYTGMEIVLAVPLMFAFAVLLSKHQWWRRGFTPSLLMGLLASGMILARLDLSLFIGLTAVLIVLEPTMRHRVGQEQVFGFALGLIPFGLYLLFNHVYFGTWLPVSGMAKQMRFGHAPTLRPWASVYVNGMPNWLNLLPVHAAVIALPFAWRRLTPTQRVLFPAALLFPFLYVLCLSCVSDWQLWLWYMYPFRLALCVSFILFSLFLPMERVMKSRIVLAAACVILLAEVLTSKWWTDVQPPIYAAAAELATFESTHPGIYAMGDRSGMVGYLFHEPMVQTEGLMMDRSYLQHIMRQDPLIHTLQRYGVRYYVGTAWKPYTGCFQAVEPFQAGTDSPHMKGAFCEPPLAEWQNDQYRTLVFQVPQ